MYETEDKILFVEHKPTLSKSRLTIAIDRITIKWVNEEDLKFLEHIVNSPGLVNHTKTLRGEVKVNPRTLQRYIRMRENRGNKNTFQVIL